jgi:hypothetical protein
MVAFGKDEGTAALARVIVTSPLAALTGAVVRASTPPMRLVARRNGEILRITAPPVGVCWSVVVHDFEKISDVTNQMAYVNLVD